MTSWLHRRLVSFVSVLLVAWLVPACAPRVVLIANGRRPERAVEIPLHRSRAGHLFVYASVEGGTPAAFLLDTGAPRSSITPRIRDALDRQDEPGRAGLTIGVGGRTQTVPLLELERIVIGPLEHRTLEVDVLDAASLADDLPGEPVGGILGMNFLTRHDVAIDLSRDLLRLYPPGEMERLAGARLAGLQAVGIVTDYARWGVFVEARIDGGPTVLAKLDLGAAFSTLNRAAAEDAGLDLDEHEILESRMAVGTDDRPIQCRRYRFEELDIGALVVQHPTLMVCDLLQDLEERIPLVLLGLDLLADRELWFLFSDHRLYISPRRPVSEADPSRATR